MTEQEGQRRIAFHEAGHAVADVLLCLPFESVSIRQMHHSSTWSKEGKEVIIEGVCSEGLTLPQERTDRLIRELNAGKLDLRDAISTMAGPQAEAMLVGEIDQEGNEAACLDMNSIAVCCRIAAAPGVPFEQVPPCAMESTIIKGLAIQAEKLLQENWAAVKVVANELLKRECLTYSEVGAIVGTPA